MGKKPSMMEALKAVGKGKPPAPEKQPSDAKRKKPQTGSSNPSRLGLVNVTGYFDPAVKQSLRLIQAQSPERRTEQDLLAEALDDLFAKYGVPQTARRVHL